MRSRGALCTVPGWEQLLPGRGVWGEGMLVRVPGSTSYALGAEGCHQARLGIWVPTPEGSARRLHKHTAGVAGLLVSDSVLMPMNSGINKFACVHMIRLFMGGVCASVQMNTPDTPHSTIHYYTGHLPGQGGEEGSHIRELICDMHVGSKCGVLSADMRVDTEYVMFAYR